MLFCASALPAPLSTLLLLRRRRCAPPPPRRLPNRAALLLCHSCSTRGGSPPCGRQSRPSERRVLPNGAQVGKQAAKGGYHLYLVQAPRHVHIHEHSQFPGSLPPPKESPVCCVASGELKQETIESVAVRRRVSTSESERSRCSRVGGAPPA